MGDSKQFMQKALAEACKVEHNITPNPRVGCIIVKNNVIIATGYHRGPGHDHAETDALKKLDFYAEGADLYVTLEPCCHYGRTPPCTQAIINAGIKRVFFSLLDPNPLVAGKGIKALQEAGIETFEGLCKNKAADLNRFFIHFMTYNKPYVIAKWAMSLDGKTVTHPDDTRQITSDESQSHLHQTRNMVDAILVGVNTVLTDDPALTVRFSELSFIRHPCRIVLDSEGKTPLNAKIVTETSDGKTIIATTEKASLEWRKKMEKKVELWILPHEKNGVSLSHLLEKMSTRHFMSLLIEGGRTILESFFQEELIDETQIYLANKVIAQLKEKKRMDLVEEKTLGKDKFFRLTTQR